MDEIIAEALKLGLWRYFDIQFAYTLVSSYQHRLFLAIVTLNFYINQGHVCLPLSMLTPDKLFCGLHINLAIKACESIGNLTKQYWQELLLSSSIVSDGSFLAPLVLDKGRLYLYRMWKNECLVAQFFSISSKQISCISEDKIGQMKELLDYFFPITKLNYKSCDSDNNEKKEDVDWQKIAVFMALTRHITVISGGPGTGKTSIVFKLLSIILLLNSDVSLNIKMATPTGKSAECLNASIHLMFKNLKSIIQNCKRRNFMSLHATTIHRLLGMYANGQNVERAKRNFSFLDYLIIDESSMINLSIMAKIITFLPSTTKVIFLGDHKQLPPIEPGSIFLDLCYFIGKGYTSTFCEQLKKITNYSLPIRSSKKYFFSDNLCLLSKNYRFNVFSGIGKLAKAIHSENQHIVLSLLRSNIYEGLKYIVLKNYQDYLKMLTVCALKYSDYFKKIECRNHKNLESILNIFNKCRILCALREGLFGTVQINFLIEKILNDYGFIHLKDRNKNYVGRPIIITCNEPSLPLFNGEIGIILPDSDALNSKLFAYFLSMDKRIKKISLHMLPKYETSFAITVHKSQGSEYQDVVFIFPNKITPILTKELFYTGVTRACKYLSIYANDQIICYSVLNQHKRYAGLIERLKGKNSMGE